MGSVKVGSGSVREFVDLARDVQKAGAKQLRARLYRALSNSVRPAIEGAKESARTTLPSGGGRDTRKSRLVRTGVKTIGGVDYVTRRRKAMAGHRKTESLAERVANARYPVRVIKKGEAGIRITATERGGRKVDLSALDQGRLRHPLFGNRRHWYQQAVKPGWFTRPMEANERVVQTELQQAVDKFVDDINKGR